MGSICSIYCNKCHFAVTTENNLLMSTSEYNLDYFDKLYCSDCQKVVKVWIRKNGKNMEHKCPKCDSHNIFLLIPENIELKCPKCKKGNLESEERILTD